MTKTSSVLPRKSPDLFRNFRKSSATIVWPSESSGIFRKSSKESSLICLYDKQNNTWLLVDMKFIFSCSTWYLTRSLRSTHKTSSWTNTLSSAPMCYHLFIKGVWWSSNTNKADLWLIRLLFTYLQITAPQIWNLIFCYVFNCLSLIFWYSSISLGKCFDSSSTSSDLKFCKVKEETFRYYLC